MTANAPPAYSTSEGGGLPIQDNNASYPEASAPHDNNQQQVMYMQAPVEQQPKIVYVNASGQVVNAALQQQYTQQRYQGQQHQQYIQQPQVFSPLESAVVSAVQNWQKAPNFKVNPKIQQQK